MKFHVHVVDGNAAAAASPSPSTAPSATGTTAAMLFAHLTLRCGHLHEIVAVSASTTPAAARALALQAAASGAGGNGSSGSAAAAVMSLGADDEGALSDDTRVLQYASEVLRGAREPHGAAEAAVALPYADGGEGRIVPYAYFATPFPTAERTLRQAIACAAATATPPPPYFDMIATTDMATFDYVIEYYQRQRAQCGGGAAVKGRGTKPVGVVHVIADDPSRAAQVLQRVLEMTLKRCGYVFAVEAGATTAEEAAADAAASDVEDADDVGSEEDGAEKQEEVDGGGGTGGSSGRHAVGGGGGSRAGRTSGGAADSWVNHVDEAVHLFARLFGVDVLVALV